MRDMTFWTERISVVKSQIVAYEDAAAALIGGVQSYTLDTGQTRQTVTRFDLGALTSMIDRLYNRLATLEARAYGGAVTVRPAW